jgi:HNH endonuclease
MTADELRALIEYDPATGAFRRVGGEWRQPCTNNWGYRILKVQGKMWRAHRLAFVLMGHDIPEQVDHINLDRADNRWCNLRLATPSQNMANCKARGQLGLKGAYRHGRKFRSYIRHNNRQLFLGTYPTPEEAHAAYRKAAAQLHGEFARVA